MARDPADGSEEEEASRGPNAGEGPDAGKERSAEEERKKAEAYALDLLALRPRTVRELRTRMRAKRYDASLVEDIVARCIRAGYLDDRAFAAYWVEERSRSRPSGPARLRQELSQKGVEAATVSVVLAELLPPETETQLAISLATKKARTLRERPGGQELTAGPDRARQKRIWAFLRRRGFGLGACQAALRAIGELPDDYEADSEA